MTITQISYAIAVDRFRHFQKAAEACFVTQSTLSLQIQKLEQQLETTLFDRAQKPVGLTPAGELLLPQLRLVIEEYDRVFDIIDETRGGIKGRFSLGVIPTMAPPLIPRLVEEMAIRFPEVEMTVRELMTNDILTQLALNKLDAGVLATPNEAGAYVGRTISHEELYILSNKDLSLERDDRGKISQKTLPLDHLLVLSEGHCLRTHTLDLCSLTDRAWTRESLFKLEASNLQTLCEMIKAGRYFTLIPKLMLPHVNMLSPSGSLILQVSAICEVPKREITLLSMKPDRRKAIKDAVQQVLKEIVAHQLSMIDALQYQP